MKKITALLIGCPNVGKTSLLNHLAGSTFRVGNFPGVTVEKREGKAFYGDYEIHLIDLPGIYTTQFYTSEDERIAVEFLKSREYDLVINVVETPKLERDLHLTLELTKLQKPMVVALNMMDEAKNLGFMIDLLRLREIFNIPVVGTNGRTGEGKEKLLEAIIEVNERGISPQLNIHPSQLFTSEDSKNYELDSLSLVQGIAREVLRKKIATKKNLTSLFDTLFLHPYFGLLFLFLIFYFLFKFVFDLSSPLVDFLDGFINDFLGKGLGIFLAYLGAPDFLVEFLRSAVIGGVGTVLTLTPVLIFMFFFLTLLEASGYLPRVAFLMDRFTHRLGLHGHSVIPLLLGFGCNVPAIMALRVLSDPKDKLIVMAMIPFMSCSARLVIFAFFASLFFANPFLVIFSLYLLGLFLSVLTGLFLSKKVYHKDLSHFVMDLPPYRLPSLKFLLKMVWVHLKRFLVRAGTIIFVVSVVLWFLLNLPWGVKNLEDSYAGRVGKVIAPVFDPLGLSDWRVATSMIPALLAREAIISNLAVIVEEEEKEKLFSEKEKGSPEFLLVEELKKQGENLGEAGKKAFFSLINPWPSFWEEDEEISSAKQKIRKIFTPAQAVSFLVFVLINTSCLATIVTMAKEGGRKIAFLFFFYSFGLGWVLASLTYQIAKLFWS